MFRPIRKKKNEISVDKAKALLHSSRRGVLAVNGDDGYPYAIPINYLYDEENEKIISIEDTLELHLDRIFPQRDIVAMKTNNVASYSDVLVTCMRQNPKWILLSEVRSAEAVSAVRNSISSGHNILSTIHADKAASIPYRLYSLMETDLEVDQFLNTIYRYIQIGVHIRAYYSKKYNNFHREVDEVTEFYVDDNNKPVSRTIYRKNNEIDGVMIKPSDHLVEYLDNQKDLADSIDNTIKAVEGEEEVTDEEQTPETVAEETPVEPQPEKKKSLQGLLDSAKKLKK